MTELRQTVLSRDTDGALTDSCARMLEEWLAGMRGVRGFTLRSTIAAARRTRPDLMRRAASRVLPECLDALDPLYAEWLNLGEGSFSAFIGRHRDRAAAALLQRADGRAEGAANTVVASLYQRLRAGARADAGRLASSLAGLVDHALSM